MKPDFRRYSLALVKDDKIIHSSSKKGIRPLVECVELFKGKESNCIIHDKVIGLAAAKIIIYSGIADSVVTEVASRSAAEYLKSAGIILEAVSFADNILNNERSDICPMEKKAMSINDNTYFFLRMREILRMQS